MSFLSLSTKTRDGCGTKEVVIRDLVELEKSDEAEDAEVMLSASEKDNAEKVEERELGLEVAGEMTSGEESGEGKAFTGMSMKNLSRVGVGEIMGVLDIMAKISSASCLWSDSRSC
jgi:hypothetical protein